jgi:DNA-binding response OmpR family regulator
VHGSRWFVARTAAIHHDGRNWAVCREDHLTGNVRPEGVLVNLLVVQEEPPVASFIKRGLEAEGFVVRTACDGAEGLELSRSADLDLIVLDLVLPTVTGEEILARLRAAGSSVPVIVLTSSDAVPDQVAILNAGADDYVTRPYSFSELLARIRARLRAADQTVSTTFSHGRVTIDVATREVRIGGRSVELTPREFALLETLMRHAGQVLSQAQLLDQVWGYDRGPSSNVVEVYVGYLRKKLRRDVVETIRGAGYRFRG